MINLIILLIFGSVAYLAYEGLPYFLGIYAKMQSVRLEKVAKQLEQMFIFKETARLITMFMLAPLGCAILGLILFKSSFGFIGGLFLGFLLPKALVKKMAALRQNKFQGQLVDSLMLLSSCLRAGLSLNQAFEVLAEEMPPPMSDELALVLKENKMGVAFEDCLKHLRKRMPLDDVDLIATAINIARETGGNLTEIFGQLVFTMREKKRLEDRVKTLTVQGRLQGYIMMVLPVAFAIFIHYVNPGNFQILLDDAVGRVLLVWCGISEIIGIFLISRLSKVEV